jgi:hypothetical protein
MGEQRCRKKEKKACRQTLDWKEKTICIETLDDRNAK